MIPQIHALRRAIPLAAALLFAAPTFAADAEPQRGTLTDRVITKADPAQSYALYLPSTYSADKAWPIILCFDSAALGRRGVERLQAAAEKYGYVIAGSNNIRNGPVAAQLVGVQAMLVDVSARFRLDARRIYTAGVSGGGRLAFQIAFAGKIRGVIACSTGLPAGAEFPELADFAVFSAAGRTDFNWAELREVDGAAEDLGLPRRFETFEGGAGWAPAAAMTRAIEWFEILAMRDGVRPRDEALIKSLLAERAAAIPQGTSLAAWAANRDIATDFKGLADVTTYAQRAKTLAATPAVRTAAEADRAGVTRELKLLADLTRATVYGELPRVKTAGAEIRKMAATTAGSPDQLMAARLLTQYRGSMNDLYRGLITQGAYDEAISLATGQIAFDPTARNHYNLARALAFDGKTKQSLEALKSAVAAGYNTPAQAQADAAFAKLKDTPDFKAILGVQ